MERLTEKRNGENVIPLRNAVCGVDLPYWKISGGDLEMFLYGDAVDRLAYYEELKEQSRLVVLPDKQPEFDFVRVFKLIMGDYEGLVMTLRCKVGDTVYLKDCYGNMYTDTVRRIIVDESKIVYDTGGIGFDETAIGVSVFLTRAEAEKATKGD